MSLLPVMLIATSVGISSSSGGSCVKLLLLRFITLKLVSFVMSLGSELRFFPERLSEQATSGVLSASSRDEKNLQGAVLATFFVATFFGVTSV